MKDKFLLIAVALGLTATALIYISTKYPDDLQGNGARTSKSMEKSLTFCKNVTLEIESHTYKLMGGKSRSEDIAGGSGILTLNYGNHATRGLIDSGPVNDLICSYDLKSESGEVKTFIGVFLGLTNDVYSSAGILALGNDIKITDVKISNNRGYVTFTTKEGEVEKKTIYFDGEMANFYVNNTADVSLD